MLKNVVKIIRYSKCFYSREFSDISWKSAQRKAILHSVPEMKFCPYLPRMLPDFGQIRYIFFLFYLNSSCRGTSYLKKTDELVPSATTDLLKPVLALHRNISCLEFLYLSITRVWPSVTVFVEFVPLRLMTSDIDNLISSSRWHYSPRWALASSTISLQASRFLALSLHSFTLIFLMSMDTSSSHLIFGLPLRLVAYSFPYIFFGTAVSCILSTGCPGGMCQTSGECSLCWTIPI